MKEMITSSKNAQLKNISALLKAKKERDASGLFVIEGLRIVKDAIKYAPDYINTIYMSEAFDSSLLETDITKYNYETVKASVFDDISGTVSSQGILAIVKKPEYTLDEILKAAKGEKNPAGPGDGKKYLLLEDIQDPGNLGTMVRTAEAAGINAIIMSAATADIFNPKVIRSTMGSCFRVPFVYAEDFPAAVEELKKSGVRVYAAYLHGGNNYKNVSFNADAAIMIGNEGNGLSDAAVLAADERVFIPMCGQIESLNAAVAGAILMYAI